MLQYNKYNTLSASQINSKFDEIQYFVCSNLHYEGSLVYWLEKLTLARDLDAATYNCPCEKHGRCRYNPTFSKV